MRRSPLRPTLILLLGGACAGAEAAEFLCPSFDLPLSIDRSALEAPDDSAVDIEADEGEVQVDGDAALEGNVRIRQGQRQINAQNVQYDAARDEFDVQGRVEFSDPLVSVAAEEGRYGAARGARFESAEFTLHERNARGQSDVLALSPEGVIRLEGVKFTTCPASQEAWALRADSITLDTNTRLGTGRGARVDFQGVPILYLPWLSFPLGSERKSGFLFPSVGHSTRSGLQLVAPYYWNIAPNLDLTFSPVLYSRRGIDLATEFRYLTPRHRGEIDVSYLPEDQLADRYRNHVRFTHVTELASDLRLEIDAANVSDPEYFEDFATSTAGTSVPFLERVARVMHRDENWRFAFEAQHFQTIDQTLPEAERPYARVPRVVWGADYGWGESDRLRYGFESELVNFERETGVTGWRLDLRPNFSFDFGGPGYFVRPGIAWRHTQYELDDTAPGQPRSPTRTLPIGSLDLGVLLERPLTGERKLTLEPRMLYFYVPYRNQDDLPLFDVSLPDLNVVQLFRTNRYIGVDRVSDANQLNVGVTSRLIDSRSGAQYLTATLGQTLYFEQPRVSLPGETLDGRERSDLVAQLALSGFRGWNADMGLQWNPAIDRSERAQVNLQYQPQRDRVLNLSYRFQRESIEQQVAAGVIRSFGREPLEQAEISTAWPVGGNWHAFGRFIYSMEDDEPLERFAGFEYRACCWRVRAVAGRFVSSRTGEQSTGVYLQLELAGLASVGSAADAFLEGAIRGYSSSTSTP